MPVAKVEAEKKPEKKVEKTKGENRIAKYLRETWYELKKVSWPTRSEAANLTLIVVAVTAFLSLVLGLMDYVFSTVFRLFLG